MQQAKEWTKDGMKQIVNTGCKEFDNYIIAISTGNVIGGGQFSLYVRPFNETECNGFTWEKGHLRNFDLKSFSNLPNRVRKYVESVTQDESIILYKFYHYNRNYSRRYRGWGNNHAEFIIHGYVVTDREHKLMQYFVTGPTYKSEQVIMGVIPYIVEEPIDLTGKGNWLRYY